MGCDAGWRSLSARGSARLRTCIAARSMGGRKEVKAAALPFPPNLTAHKVIGMAQLLTITAGNAQLGSWGHQTIKQVYTC